MALSTWLAILQLILYLICGYFSQSDSQKVHLLSLRQLSHNTCRSWVCVFCCERAKRSTNRSEISVFKQHVSPVYDLNNVRFLNGIYTTLSWYLYRRTCWDFFCLFLSSAQLTQCINKAQRNERTCGCFIRKTVTFDQVQGQGGGLHRV